MSEEKEKIEPYYQNNAKQVVDTLFEAKLFREDIKRDEMQDVEDLLAFLYQMFARSSKRSAEWAVKFKELKK